MSKQFWHRGADTSRGDSSTLVRHAQLINERAHILGLQLQQAALATRIAAAVCSYGLPTPQQQLHELLQRGIIHDDLAAARAEVASLKALLERAQSGRLTSISAASSSGPSRFGAGRQASSGGGGSGCITARAAGSKQYGALVADHVRHWLDQAQEAVLLLEDLVVPGSIDEWPLDAPEPPPPPRPPGGYPVAHFIQRIPPELTALMQLPTTSYDQPSPPPPQPAPPPPGLHANPPQSAAAAAAALDVAAVLWDAPPLLRDPSPVASTRGGGASLSPGYYRVACHESAELMWPSLAHGDLVLLLPGRYNWPEGTVQLRAAVRVLGLGRQRSDVVIHNNEEDDVFVECAAGPPPPPPLPQGGARAAAAATATAAAAEAPARAGGPSSSGGGGACSAAEANGVVFENLTLLQLGGYEGALRVLRGRTTLVDVVVQFTMGGLQVDSGAHLVLRNVRVVGGATAGVQVAPGGLLEMFAGSEVTRCGGGDDVVPKDLGGVELMVSLADYPRLASPCPRTLIQAHADVLSGGSSPQERCPAAPPQPPQQQRPTAAVATPAPLELLQPHLGAVQPPATVVIGPGCTIQNTRGFAIAIVKRRALAAYHELLYNGGGSGSHVPYGTSGGGGSGGGGGGGCSLAAALEGARVLVSRGSVLGPNNSRGAVGVVELEYHQLDGDEVNRRTASRHFHAVQMTSRQLQEGFASPGVDWTSYRIRLDGQLARPGRRAMKVEVAAAAAAAAAAAGTSDGGSRRNCHHHYQPQQQGVLVGSRSLRQLLIASVTRVQRRQRDLAAAAAARAGCGGSTSDDSNNSESDSYDDSEGCTTSTSSSNGIGGGGDGSSSDGGQKGETRCGGQLAGKGGGGVGFGTAVGGVTEGGVAGLDPRGVVLGVGTEPAGSGGGAGPENGGGGVGGGGFHCGRAGEGGRGGVGGNRPSRVCGYCGWSPPRDPGRAAAVAAAAVAGPSEREKGGREGRGGDRAARVDGISGRTEDVKEVTAVAVHGHAGSGSSSCPGGVEAVTAIGASMVTDAGGGGGGEAMDGADRPGAATAVACSSSSSSSAANEGEGRGDPALTASPANPAVAEKASSPSADAVAGNGGWGHTPPAVGGTGNGEVAPEPGASGKDIVSIITATAPGGRISSGGGSGSGGHLKLRRCGGCLAMSYCSEECQRRDWPRHAPECRKLRAAAAGAGARGEVT